jgi:uncharacterized protein YdeI (YjbR/CyaY-like superfamily)
VLKAIRAELGKGPDDVVRVTVELDEAERTVEIPADLRSALDGAGMLGVFTALSFTHQREHVGWIEEAKRPETSARRISWTMERVRPA